MDIAILTLVCLSFSAWLTLHVILVVGLAKEVGRAKATLAFIVLPLAPYFALRTRAKNRAVLWLTALSTYVLLVWVASR